LIGRVVVLLDAPDTVLIERANGKRIDPETGGNLENVDLTWHTHLMTIISSTEFTPYCCPNY